MRDAHLPWKVPPGERRASPRRAASKSLPLSHATRWSGGPEREQSSMRLVTMPRGLAAGQSGPRTRLASSLQSIAVRAMPATLSSARSR